MKTVQRLLEAVSQIHIRYQEIQYKNTLTKALLKCKVSSMLELSLALGGWLVAKLLAIVCCSCNAISVQNIA